MEDFSAVEKLVEETEGGGDGWVTHETGDFGDDNDEGPAEMTLENMKLDDERQQADMGDDDEGISNLNLYSVTN